jgi:GNAT superfamily N-acetyltransferase
MKVRIITNKDIELILSLDKKIYPTDSPVQEVTIRNWYKNNPEFGMIFEENGKVVGTAIVIPLNKIGWENLINGKLAESELDEKTLFDNARDNQIGIHIYHLEKLDNTLKGFYKIVLENLRVIINDLKKKNSKLELIGFSGLCVSKEGIGLFENKFDCKERAFKTNEHILRKAEKNILIKSDKSEEDIKKQNKSMEYIARCKMLVLYPNENSEIWNYLNSDLKDLKIISLDKIHLEESIRLLNSIFLDQDDEENADSALRASLNLIKYKKILEKWKIPKLSYYLAIVNDCVVGTSGIYEMEGDKESAWVGWTSVASEYRNRGIGKKLVSFVIEKAKILGYKKLKLHTVDIDYQKNAHKLYESLGFKLISVEKNREIGHDRLYYELLF